MGEEEDAQIEYKLNRKFSVGLGFEIKAEEVAFEWGVKVASFL